jgi:hypothetical protein
LSNLTCTGLTAGDRLVPTQIKVAEKLNPFTAADLV